MSRAQLWVFVYVFLQHVEYHVRWIQGKLELDANSGKCFDLFGYVLFT